jgi:hypothetical protein
VREICSHGSVGVRGGNEPPYPDNSLLDEISPASYLERIKNYLGALPRRLLISGRSLLSSFLVISPSPPPFLHSMIHQDRMCTAAAQLCFCKPRPTEYSKIKLLPGSSTLSHV